MFQNLTIATPAAPKAIVLAHFEGQAPDPATQKCRSCKRPFMPIKTLLVRVRCDVFSSERAEAVRLGTLPKVDIERVRRGACGGYQKCDCCVYRTVEDRRGPVRFYAT